VTQRPVLELRIGERLELRKPHPCGGRTWDVVRLGADIGLVCETCGHRVLMERRDVERQLRRRLEPAGAPGSAAADARAGDARAGEARAGDGEASRRR
jgi:hypothetical protein